MQVPSPALSWVMWLVLLVVLFQGPWLVLFLALWLEPFQVPR